MDNKENFVESKKMSTKIEIKEPAELRKDDLFSRSIMELDEKSHKKKILSIGTAESYKKYLGMQAGISFYM